MSCRTIVMVLTQQCRCPLRGWKGVVIAYSSSTRPTSPRRSSQLGTIAPPITTIMSLPIRRHRYTVHYNNTPAQRPLNPRRTLSEICTRGKTRRYKCTRPVAMRRIRSANNILLRCDIIPLEFRPPFSPDR